MYKMYVSKLVEQDVQACGLTSEFVAKVAKLLGVTN